MNIRNTNIQNAPYIYLIYLFCIIFICSCSNIKNIPSNQSILIQNKIKIKHIDGKKDRRPLEDETYVIPVQKPNKSIFNFFRIKLWLYNSVNEKTANPIYKQKLYKTAKLNNKSYDSLSIRKFNHWIKYTLGEAPVIFDSTTIPETEKLLNNYFFNKGYYYKNITSSFKTIKKRTTVSYTVKIEEPFKIYDVIFPKGNTEIEKIIQDNKSNTKLVFGEYFDVLNLKLERDRLANDLRNRGYYDITRENFTFDIDTSFDYKKLNLRLVISRPDTGEYKCYSIRNIYVYPNFEISNINRIGYNDTIKSKGIDFISNIHKFRPNRLTDFIFLREGDKYNQEMYQLTLQRLTNLGVFKFSNIEYVPANKDIDNNKLDVFIYLTPNKRQSFSLDFDQNYSTNGTADKSLAGLLGSGISFSYRNKNLSRNADQFSVTASASLQYVIGKKGSSSLNANTFGVIDLGIEFAYSQNRFILPFKIKKPSFKSNPKTRLSISYNYQQRFNFFTINRVNLKYGYDWFSSSRVHHYFNLIDLSVLSLITTESFNQSLEDNPIQKLSFTDGIIPATNYTLVYNGQKDVNDNKYINYLFNAEIAGNLANGVAWTFNKINPKYSLDKIFDTRYFQYIKFESDLKYYFINDDKSALVGRLYGGIGIPYGNRAVLPFNKQFSVGGPNSVRAFRPFSVGPGATIVDNSKNNLQLGDFKLEASAEYRFGLYKWFKGALFVDAGNVWNIRKLPSQPDAEFELSDFYKEIAVGAGAGVRADFQFFVIRFDVGFKLYDPSFPVEDRWRISKYQENFRLPKEQRYSIYNINLAIGYPF